MINQGKLCKTISKYIKKKVIALVWEYIVLNSFFWHSCPRKLGQLCQKNSFNTIYSHTRAITYSTADRQKQGFVWERVNLFKTDLRVAIFRPLIRISDIIIIRQSTFNIRLRIWCSQILIYSVFRGNFEGSKKFSICCMSIIFYTCTVDSH